MQQRAFTRAARAHDNRERTLRDIQRDSRQSGDLVFALLVDFADVEAANHGIGDLGNTANFRRRNRAQR